MAASIKWQQLASMLLIWLIILLYISNTSYVATVHREEQFVEILHKIHLLKKQNLQLRRLTDELSAQMSKPDINSTKTTKSSMHKYSDKKNLERNHPEKENITGLSLVQIDQLHNGVNEFWYYMKSQLRTIQHKSYVNLNIISDLDNIMESGADRQSSILADLSILKNASFLRQWSEEESKQLSSIVQKRLHYLQNPKDCNTAKKVVCNINKGCGYGCQLHHLVYCFIIAYGTERTLILESKGWRYSPEGWESVFKPLSETCITRRGESTRLWASHDEIKDFQVVHIPIVDNISPKPFFLPPAIPVDLAPRLKKLHGHPVVWWIGQFLKYILRPQDELYDEIEKAKKRLGFKRPIVGVHVRRTDKIRSEASFHSIEEYMIHVDNFYDSFEKIEYCDKRRIYLATDDQTLLQEAKRKFPKYEIISDNEIARDAGLKSRYTKRSLYGVIKDIHFLSMSDYVVCTFSSQVCRVAYEIMQTHHPDASGNFYSLDDIYYFGGQNAHNQQAIFDHHARDHQEIDLRSGDLIGVAGNHWNGYSKGVNKRTGKKGLFPSYKVKDRVDTADFPTYDPVKDT